MALELYVHIPFCIKKCGYCDFVSAPAGRGQQDAYMEALRWEICRRAENFRRRDGILEPESVVSVFFGGGTPSVAEASQIEKTMSCIRREFVVAEDAEITLEANPGTLTPEKLSCYRRAGINRLSIGLQSANDKELELLGRIHTFAEFKESYRLAREAGFKNINVDIMAALPGQTVESFTQGLWAVMGLSPAPEHISVYSLIIEEGTPFFSKYHRQAAAREAGGKDCSPLPSEEAERAMYEETGRFLETYGYGRYEISNYARPGFSCKHNIGYWTGIPYLGFGISAASYTGRKRFSNTPVMEEYLQAAGGADFKTIQKEEETVTKTRAMEEFMFLGLRMARGVSEKEFEKRFGRKMKDVYGEILKGMERKGLMGQRFSEREKGIFWYLTGRGIDVSNYVLAEFLL